MLRNSRQTAYWEDRARRFAVRGEGLAAVCSYGMPKFYNRSIEWAQRLALRSWLDVPPGMRVLDVGCGVGRWSRRMASRGASVVGVDLSPTMVAEAQRRAESQGVDDHCRFLVSDLAHLDLGERFERILGVTVLQHMLDPARLESAIARLVAHLEPGGQLILLEAMPTQATARNDSAVFTARTWTHYAALFERAGLRVVELTGVDPSPMKTLFLPYYSRLPSWMGKTLLAMATVVSLPIDLLLGRRLVRASWHKLVVLEHDRV